MTARRSRLAVAAGVLTAGVAVVAGTALAPGAGAAVPVSQASGRFLSGSIGNTRLDQTATVGGAQAANAGGPAVTQQHPLSASLLRHQLSNLPNGVQLPGGGVLTLGAVNEFAQANPDGSAHGASGAITNQGAIALGGASSGQGSATLDFDPSKLAIPNVPSTGIGIGHLKLTVGAVAATADQAAGDNGTQTGSYRVAGVRLELSSPLLAQTVDTVFGPLLHLLTGTPLQQLTDALDHVDYGGGAIVGSLSDGSLTIDVDKLLAYLHLDINDLPPNTHLLSYLATAFPALLSDGPGNLQSVLDQLLGNSALIDLTSVINGVLGQLQLAAQQGTPTLRTFLTKLAGQAQNLIDPIVNVQQRSGGMFVERALRLDVVGDPLAVINLATATVGPGSGPVQPTPSGPASTPPAPHSGANGVVTPPGAGPTGGPGPGQGPGQGPGPGPGSLAYTGTATTWLTKAGLFGLLGLCLGAALFGATLGARRFGARGLGARRLGRHSS